MHIYIFLHTLCLYVFKLIISSKKITASFSGVFSTVSSTTDNSFKRVHGQFQSIACNVPETVEIALIHHTFNMLEITFRTTDYDATLNINKMYLLLPYKLQLNLLEK